MPPKSFFSVEHEAALSVLRAAAKIQQESSEVLKPFDLTGPQFNVLRILRGAADGLPCGQIGDRMINRDPDITRLLDRLEARMLIERERSEDDRRVVTARISQNGVDLLKRIDPVVYDSHRSQFSGMTEKQMRQVIELMEHLQEAGD